jgi:hypothetical protein
MKIGVVLGSPAIRVVWPMRQAKRQTIMAHLKTVNVTQPRKVRENQKSRQIARRLTQGFKIGQLFREMQQYEACEKAA